MFCNDHLRRSTKEHVIPKWLIEMTGAPNRLISFGARPGRSADQVKNIPFEPLKIPFKALTVPACHACNQAHSGLEDRAAGVIKRMVGWRTVSALELDTLLDWFDKMRIGLWFAALYLQPYATGVQPGFGAVQRIGTKDRALAIYRTHGAGNGIRFWGVELPTFQHVPCCFTIAINDLCMCNLSIDFLIAERFGFPYARNMESIGERGEMSCELREGRQKMRLPLLDDAFWAEGTTLYQACFGFAQDSESNQVLYDVPHVRANCMDWHGGKSILFMERAREYLRYPEERTSDWVPSNPPDLLTVWSHVVPRTYALQLRWLRRLERLRCPDHD